MIKRHPSLVPVHPGEILREDVLPALGMTKTAVAGALGNLPADPLRHPQREAGRSRPRWRFVSASCSAMARPFGSNLQRARDLAIAERTVDVSGIPTLETSGRLSE